MQTAHWFVSGAVLLLCHCGCLPAQVPATQDSVTVTERAEPLIDAQLGRSRSSIGVEPVQNLLPEWSAALRTDASVDLQSRGPFGVQTDISMRGSTFEQVLVLLNGLRINDAETSHFNLDVPVPLSAIASVAVLHGSSSTLYGSDALAGAVDLRTVRPQQTAMQLRTGFGNYGTQQQQVTATLTGAGYSNLLAAGRDFSTGFLFDRDFRSESAMNELRTTTHLGESDVLLAGSDRAFGANQFYGNYASWERTKGWFAAWTQTFPTGTSLAVAYRRHTDDFVLLRNRPTVYRNRHADESWQAFLRHRFTLGSHAYVFTGLDNNLDQIDSSNLGRHGRNRSAGYADLQVDWKRWWLSAALREEGIGGHGMVAAPGLSGVFRATKTISLRSALGRGFRLPTYVNRYYSDPATLANPSLRPESAWTFDSGVDWVRGKTRFSATGFRSQQTDAIDYVRANSSAPYQAQNLSHVVLTGAELAADVAMPSRQQLHLSYTRVFGAQSALGGLQSRTLFNYPEHNASAEWTGTLSQVAMRMRVGAAQRIGRTAYATLDLSATRTQGRVRPYLLLTNLTNTGYEEIQGVRMQGRGVLGGMVFVLQGRRSQ